jgi:putative heme iron utilization protein
MFKVFVRRDRERQLLPEQLAMFEALKAIMS